MPDVNTSNPANPSLVLVTGATGFLGGHVVRTLLKRGVACRALGRNTRAGLELMSLGADFRPVDLTDKASMHTAFTSVTAVVHSAALSSAWGTYQEFYNANVVGTEHVLDACLANHVGRLVHISSPSVMSRHEVQLDLDESHPLPESFVSLYSQTKAMAEQRVRGAIARGLNAVILRPKAIYGEGDTALLPRLVRAIGTGRLPILGSGETLTNITHVSDVVDAVLRALERPEALGNTYVITGGPPVNLWDVVNMIADQLGVPRPSRRISVSRGMAIATVLEWLWKLLPLKGEPPLTRYTVSVFSHSQTYNTRAAERDLGYEPRVPWQQGLQECLQALAQREQRKPEPTPPAHPKRDSDVQVTMTVLASGYTLGPGWAIHDPQRWKWKAVPAMFAVLHHPRVGPILFDSGYSTHFAHATRKLPFRLYRLATPVVTPSSHNTAALLRKHGVDPANVKYILLSHFDPDHVGGLTDLPNARVVCLHTAWNAIHGKRGWSALHHRVLPDLLPDDLSARVLLLPTPDDPSPGPLGPQLDWLGDGSIRIVALPGHAPGHLGALVQTRDHGTVLLCADAVWTTRQLTDAGPRNGLHRVIAADGTAQDETYRRLIRLKEEFPHVRIMPTHCPVVAEKHGLNPGSTTLEEARHEVSAGHQDPGHR